MLLVPKTEFEKSLAEAFKELPEISKEWVITTGLQGIYSISKRIRGELVVLRIVDRSIWGIVPEENLRHHIIISPAGVLFPQPHQYAHYMINTALSFAEIRGMLENISH